jgi:hypothetical protein
MFAIIPAASPCRSVFGSQPSQLGRYQFQSPSSFIVAGRSIARTMVASTSTAAASPIPSSFMSMIGSVAKIEKTPTMTRAALETVPAVVLIPCATASSVVMPRSYASRTRLRMNTW